jgi:hypothetical protein
LTLANCLASIIKMNTEQKTERALIRTIAGASRKLDQDLELSPLQAIDRLLKMNVNFKELWVHFPWLVLEHGQHLAANMPVPQMLAEIEKHGEPIGLAGVALLQTTQRYTALKMMFRKDEKSRKTVEKSAEVALDVLTRRIRRMQELWESVDTQSEHHPVVEEEFRKI